MASSAAAVCTISLARLGSVNAPLDMIVSSFFYVGWFHGPVFAFYYVIENGHMYFAVLAAIASAVFAVCYIKFLGCVFFEEPEWDTRISFRQNQQWFFAFLVVLVGVMPDVMRNWLW